MKHLPFKPFSNLLHNHFQPEMSNSNSAAKVAALTSFDIFYFMRKNENKNARYLKGHHATFLFTNF